MKHTIETTINGETRTCEVEARQTLVDFLRDDLSLTGTHVGCEHGACGACTVLVDGDPVRSCLMLAVQARGRTVTTIEGLTPESGLSALQEAFWESHSFQCGFCTPGFVVSMHAFLDDCPSPTDEQIREALAGNLCRCTGYQSIAAGVRLAADRAGTPPATARVESA
jgi:carbon-monoxide dehydrogenase small subunit